MTEEQPFAFAEQIALSKDASAVLHPDGSLGIKTRHHHISLDASETWNLLQWLADHQRDRIYQLVQHGVQETVCEHCRMAPCICADPPEVLP